MKRLIILVFLLAFVLCGCGETAVQPDAPIDEILAEIIEEADIQQPLPLEANLLFSLYGISEDDVEQSACCVTVNGIFPDEILIVQAKNADAASRIESCFNTRLSEVLIQSKSYDAESYAAAQKCHVVKNGLYISLFISAKHEKMNETYAKHFK